MKKMNNKGFSLVELIVVVLIMAIIAVALAPQVMKWVENSRKSTDIENYNALVEAANVASTNENYLKVVADEVITMNATNTSVGNTAGKTQLEGVLNETLPGWDKTKITGAWANETVDTCTTAGVQGTATFGSSFTITITKSTNGIKVIKSIAPRKNFS